MPEKSGPVSTPSSNTMLIERTFILAVIGGNAVASCAAVQCSRVQPVFGVSPSAVGGAGSTVPGGELQPTKCVTPSVVTTLKRGAPAPQ